MHPRMKRNPLCCVLPILALSGLALVGCDEVPPDSASKALGQVTPYQIQVPRDSRAVASVDINGNVTIIAVTEDGRGEKPAECQIEGPKKCPFELPEMATTIEIGKVSEQPNAKAGGMMSVAVAANGRCLFVIKVGNMVYYYPAGCTP